MKGFPRPGSGQWWKSKDGMAVVAGEAKWWQTSAGMAIMAEEVSNRESWSAGSARALAITIP